MSRVDQLRACMVPDVSIIVVTYRGRKYVVTQGTGERHYAARLGGGAAFAYATSDLRVANLRPEDWNYSDWCNTVSTVEDLGLAKKLAREHGLRLTRGGDCTPVLSDEEFSKLAAL